MTRSAVGARALINKATSIRVAIYVRISQDRTGAGMGVKRQEKLCREYVAQRDGWDVADVYVDNDTSASDLRKPRKQWQRLVADIKAGHIDAIVVWHVDRMTRQPRELEDVIALHEKYGTQLGTVTGEIDLSTPTGRMVARMLGAAARNEIEHKIERQRAASQQSAEAGRPWYGGPRPFGYDFDRVAVKPDEAELIRLAAKRVLAGESLSSIVNEWNDEGICTTQGKRWSAPSLRLVLTSARISGRREVGRKSGQLGEIVADGLWDAIVDVETSDKLRRLFMSAERKRSARATAPRHLLSGLLSCSLCGYSMTSGIHTQSGSRRIYRCDPKQPGQGEKMRCGRLSASAPGAERHVVELAIEFLSQPKSQLMQRLAARRDESMSATRAHELTKQITRDEQELIDLMTDRQEGAITRAEWAAAREIVDARLRSNRAELARATQTNALTLVADADDMHARWESLNLSQQKAVLRDLFVTIKVLPSKTRGGGVFDTDRLEPEWKL